MHVNFHMVDSNLYGIRLSGKNGRILFYENHMNMYVLMFFAYANSLGASECEHEVTHEDYRSRMKPNRIKPELPALAGSEKALNNCVRSKHCLYRPVLIVDTCYQAGASVLQNEACQENCSVAAKEVPFRILVFSYRKTLLDDI